MIFGMWCAESRVSVIASSWQLLADSRGMPQSFCCRKMHLEGALHCIFRRIVFAAWVTFAICHGAVCDKFLCWRRRYTLPLEEFYTNTPHGPNITAYQNGEPKAHKSYNCSIHCGGQQFCGAGNPGEPAFGDAFVAFTSHLEASQAGITMHSTSAPSPTVGSTSVRQAPQEDVTPALCNCLRVTP